MLTFAFAPKWASISHGAGCTTRPMVPSNRDSAFMDRDRRRQLKAWGKAEVARESAALQASLRHANPAAPGDDQWASHYRLGVMRERWLREKLPLLRSEKLNSLFVVHPWGANTSSAHLGGYVLCGGCGTASPSAIPRKVFYWKSCGCGNIRWRCFFGWTRNTVKDPSLLLPVKLIGKG